MKRTGAGVLLLMIFCAVMFSGCGSTHQPPTVEGKKPLRLAMVTDIGGLNDRSFNASAYKGLLRSEKELGAEIRVFTSASNSDYIPNLAAAARQKYDLIIGVGFLMSDALGTVAQKFPDRKFAIIDFPQAAVPGKPKNVSGLLFSEQEAGYLVGYLAALHTKSLNKKNAAVSTIGGQKIPPVEHYIAGYRQGVKAVDPDMPVLVGYSQNFMDQAKCKEIALNQIHRGSKVVFQVAGQCGLGALDAAREKGLTGIGVDAEQSYLGPFMLSTALKNIDVAVLEVARKLVQENRFSGGSDEIFDMRNNGVGFGELNEAALKFKPQLEKAQGDIASGKIKVAAE